MKGKATSAELLEIDIRAGNGAKIVAGGRWTPLVIAAVTLILGLLYFRTI